MWACLAGIGQEAFEKEVGDDEETSRWLVNERVAVTAQTSPPYLAF